MTTPPPIDNNPVAQRAMVLGAMVFQSPAAALLSHSLCRAAEDLWDAATAEDSADMCQQVRVVASRLLALCPPV